MASVCNVVRRRTTQRLPLVLAVLVTLIAAGCSSSGDSSANPGQTSAPPLATTPPATTSSSACAAVTAKASAKPPANVPVPRDATFYTSVTAGSTTQYFAVAAGDAVKQRRDAIKTQLQQAGYVIKGSDAEDNEEAELDFEGKGHAESSIQVIHRPGCEGQLRVRYQISR
jgi:hypothetical protein